MFDIALLGFLVAAAQQDNDGVAPQREVGAVAGADVDSHFRDALANWFHITQIASGGAIKTARDCDARLQVAQAPVPDSELFRELDDVGPVINCILSDTVHKDFRIMLSRLEPTGSASLARPPFFRSVRWTHTPRGTGMLTPIDANTPTIPTG